jgi:hypothetical protein
MLPWLRHQGRRQSNANRQVEKEEVMLLETLKALEVALHDPAIRNNAEKMGKLLHPLFREFGRSGASYTHEEILAHICAPGQQQPSIWAQDFELEVLSEGLALLIYRSGHLTEGGKLQRHTNRSSLWQLVDGSWKMRFHQGTATQPFEKRASSSI